MDIILEAFYNSDKFSHKRYILENQGKTKDEIKRVVEHQLMNLDCLNDDIDTILQSQIQRLLKEKYRDHIGFPILEVFKEEYSKNITDISSNINKVRAICLEEGILLQEIIGATFKNIEDDIIKRADYFIKNEINVINDSNYKLYMSYFIENNKKFKAMFTKNTSISNDIIDILTKIQELEEFWKSKTKSDVLLIKRISDDTSLVNIKKHFKSIYETEITEIKNTLILLTCSVDKIMNENATKTEVKSKENDRIANLEKQNKSLISRIENLEKRDSDRAGIYKKQFKTLNDSIQSLSDKYINSKETLNIHESKIKEVNVKLTQSNVKLTQSIKENNVRFKENNVRFKKLSENKDNKENIEQKEELHKSINIINVTLKSLSKQYVEKDILLKDEIYKHIDSKIIESKIIDSKIIESKIIESNVIESNVISSEVITYDVNNDEKTLNDEKTSVDDINRLKEEVIKIRGEIDLIFRHNVNPQHCEQQPVNQQPQYPVNQQPQYPVNQLPQLLYPPIQYHVNQPHY